MFDSFTISLVWSKAHPIPGHDPAEWRYDKFGWVIRRTDYGAVTEYGWEIDHLVPVSMGGANVISNLRPLHWSNNRAKSNKLTLADLLTG